MDVSIIIMGEGAGGRGREERGTRDGERGGGRREREAGGAGGVRVREERGEGGEGPKGVGGVTAREGFISVGRFPTEYIAHQT